MNRFLRENFEYWATYINLWCDDRMHRCSPVLAAPNLNYCCINPVSFFKSPGIFTFFFLSFYFYRFAYRFFFWWWWGGALPAMAAATTATTMVDDQNIIGVVVLIGSGPPPPKICRGVCLQPLSALLADCPVAGETARTLHAFFNEKPSRPLPCAMCPGEVGGCALLPPPPPPPPSSSLL